MIEVAKNTNRRTDFTRALLVASITLVLVFLIAYWTREWPIFSLSPPGTVLPDFSPSQRENLHRTFFTIWGALILAAPAIALLPCSWHWSSAERIWRIMWTASMLVFFAHFYLAVVVLFKNNWLHILNTPRVTAPRLDTIFAIWWIIDVLFAWLVSSTSFWIRCQRICVHLLAFFLFFAGAALEGELLISKVMGWLFLAAITVGLVLCWSVLHRASNAPIQQIDQ